jgi:lysophospholipase L1-like esterase
MKINYLSLLLIGVMLLAGQCKQDDVKPTRQNDKDIPGDTDTTSNNFTYLALGDSYTIGQSITVSDRFPVQLAVVLRSEGYNIAEPKIIARTGWTTSDLLNALEAEQPSNNYDLVTLLIGVNNQYQGKPLSQYKEEFTTLLNRAVGYAQADKERVIVVSIPDYGYTPFGERNQPEISAELDEFNAANKEITEAAGIAYVNITPISRRGLEEPNLVASDGLHPSGRQYAKWVKLILPEAVKVVKLQITE